MKHFVYKKIRYFLILIKTKNLPSTPLIFALLCIDICNLRLKIFNSSILFYQMEAQNAKGQRCPIQEGQADHPAIKNCIKKLSKNRWLLGPSLICEQDTLSNTFSTYFKSAESILEESPLDPEGPIQLVRCISGEATWRIGEWAYFKSKACTTNSAREFANIQFVQEKAPTVPIPTVLEHYVDEMACRSYLLVSSIPGVDLNETWKTLTFKQKSDILIEVAEHIHTLAKLTSEKLQSADKKWIIEPYLSVQPKLERDLTSPEDRLSTCLVNPDESQEYEKIWGAEQNIFVFYHNDLGPTNIKIMVNGDTAKVTGLLDWELAGYLPRGWISTKFYVAGGLRFDWDGENDEREWPVRLGRLLEKLGYPGFFNEYFQWENIRNVG